MQNSIRKPIFAGRFYPATAKEIEHLLDSLAATTSLIPTVSGNHIIGGIVPHAGYVYSAKHALAFFKELKQYQCDTVVIISPGHTGIGSAISIDSNTHWETPLGLLSVDMELVESGIFKKDNSAQEFEHAAEVILPLLQHYSPHIKQIAVITMRKQSAETASEVASGLKEYVKRTGKRILVIASSDFNHFDSPKIGRQKDDNVLNKILTFDAEGVEKAVRKYNVSVCGYGPIMALLHFSRSETSEIGCRILSRGHSGEVNDSDSVVDYISMIFYER